LEVHHQVEFETQAAAAQYQVEECQGEARLCLPANRSEFWPGFFYTPFSNNTHINRSKQIEQVANVITHGIWILPAVFAAITLFKRSSSASQYLVSWVYGGALCMLFTVSTFFHCSCYCAEHK